MITVEDARAHLNITSEADDALLSDLIAAASRHIEGWCGLDLAEAFPEGAPEDMQQACRLLVGHLYENRETSIAGVALQQVNPGAYELLSRYREWCF